MKSDEITREELFAAVWEKPTSQIAREFGISDVALGKLCRKHQVPKPPRGYWARVAAGQTPKRPPLPAFREELERARKASLRPAIPARLTSIQRQFVLHALAVLKGSGADVSDCVIGFDGIRAISPDTAAQILLLVQTSHQKWLAEGLVPVRDTLGARQSLSALTAKLLPLAREQVLIFHESQRSRYGREDGPAVLVRLTPWLQRRMAGLARMVRRQRLDYVAAPLLPPECAWTMRHLFAPDSDDSARCTLCVSATEIWIETQRRRFFYEKDTDIFRTERIALHSVVAVDLLPGEPAELPAVMPRSKVAPFRERLDALRQAERVYETMLDAGSDLERAVPDERLALLDRLWHGDQGPFLAARKAWRSLEGEMNRWEAALDAEQRDICRDVLGLEVGDIAVLPARGKLVRLRVEQLSVHAGRDDVMFFLAGTRFRKDGSLGKRQESFTLHLENARKIAEKTL